MFTFQQLLLNLWFTGFPVKSSAGGVARITVHFGVGDSLTGRQEGTNG